MLRHKNYEFLNADEIEKTLQSHEKTSLKAGRIFFEKLNIMIETDKSDILESLEMFKKAAEYCKLMNEAVHEAQEENKKLGLRNVYSINGHIFYQMPDGKIISKENFESEQNLY